MNLLKLAISSIIALSICYGVPTYLLMNKIAEEGGVAAIVTDLGKEIKQISNDIDNFKPESE